MCIILNFLFLVLWSCFFGNCIYIANVFKGNAKYRNSKEHSLTRHWRQKWMWYVEPLYADCGRRSGQSLDQNSSRCTKIRNSKQIADSTGERDGWRGWERGGDIDSDRERAPSDVLGLTMKSPAPFTWTSPFRPEFLYSSRPDWNLDRCSIQLFQSSVFCRLLFVFYNL